MCRPRCAGKYALCSFANCTMHFVGAGASTILLAECGCVQPTRANGLPLLSFVSGAGGGGGGGTAAEGQQPAGVLHLPCAIRGRTDRCPLPAPIFPTTKQVDPAQILDSNLADQTRKQVRAQCGACRSRHRLATAPRVAGVPALSAWPAPPCVQCPQWAQSAGCGGPDSTPICQAIARNTIYSGAAGAWLVV